MTLSRAQVVVTAGVVGVCLGLGAATLFGFAGAKSRASHTAGSRTPDAPAAQVPKPATGPGLTAEDKAALRAMIREELRAHEAAEKGTGSGAAVPSAKPEGNAVEDLSDQQIESYQNGRALVDGAIARGMWTAEDRERLHDELATLPLDLRIEVARPIVAAVNRDAVRYTGDGPIF